MASPKLKAPIESATEGIQRAYEVEAIPDRARTSAIKLLIKKVQGTAAGKKLVVFDAPRARRSTAGNIAQKLRNAGVDAFCRTVGDSIKVFVVTK